MDKRLILSVAGSGKTSFIIEQLNLEKNSLIITYTRNNYENLRSKVIEKFGYIPKSISIFTYFDFLYNFCFKPYLYFEIPVQGISWSNPPSHTLRIKRDNPNFYIDNNNRLYYNRIAKLLEESNVRGKINHRIEKYYNNLFIDEIQDYGGHDFNFILSIVQSNIEICLVGDFFQHTFDTSSDGSVNKTLYSNLANYKIKFASIGITIDSNLLSNSYRCSPSICEFIQAKLNIPISSHRQDSTEIRLIESPEQIKQLFNCNNTVKLFYQNHHRFLCFSENWGASKGMDSYNNVCIVLNKSTYDLFTKDMLINMNERTKNKFYVACTRARGNLYFIPEHLLKTLCIAN